MEDDDVNKRSEAEARDKLAEHADVMTSRWLQDLEPLAGSRPSAPSRS